MVDIVGAEAGAHQLLEQIGLLVRAFRGAEAGERARAVAVADFHQALGGAVERLLPGRRAEMRPRIGRIDQIVGGLGDAVLAHQRLRQPMRMAHIVEAEAALDAEPVLVRRAVAAADVEQLVVLDVVGELAADAAIGAHAVDLAVRILRCARCASSTSVAGISAPVGQACTHSPQATQVDAPIGSSKSNTIFSPMAAAGHADDVVDLHFAAGADAEIALDAGVEIDRHRRMAAVGRRRRARGKAARPRCSVGRRSSRIRVRIVRDILCGGWSVSSSSTTIRRARLGAVGLGLDLHAGRRRADAARGQHALALDLDHADAAIAVGAVAGLGRIAQMRKLDAERCARRGRSFRRRGCRPRDRRG